MRPFNKWRAIRAKTENAFLPLARLPSELVACQPWLNGER
jgi:hypothetical protein